MIKVNKVVEYNRNKQLNLSIKEIVEGKFINYYSVSPMISLIHTKNRVNHLWYKGPDQASRRELLEKKALLDEFDAAIRLHYKMTCDQMNVKEVLVQMNEEFIRCYDRDNKRHISYLRRMMHSINHQSEQKNYNAKKVKSPLNGLLEKLETTHKFAILVSYPYSSKSGPFMEYNFISATPTDTYLIQSFRIIGYLKPNYVLNLKLHTKLKYMDKEIKRLNIEPRVNELKHVDQP